MEIVKLLKDYAKTQVESDFSEIISQKDLAGGLCVEKIKNKNFLISSLKPVNDFIIFSTFLPGMKPQEPLST